MSLADLLNKEFLKECHDSLGRDRSSGIDGVLIHCRPMSEFC
jgi:hypothetical protein